MIELNIITAFLTSLISLIILRPLAIKFNLVDYPAERKTHAGNIPIVGGLAILLIGILIEKYFPALSFPVFLILFLFYLFIRIYKNSEKKVKRY